MIFFFLFYIYGYSSLKPTDKGLSLFQIKNDCLLTYLTGLAHVICSKIEGQTLVQHPVVPLLIQMRITLEKIKPIESKLKYRIDKLLSSVSSKSKPIPDALSHKPNLAAFQDTSSGEEDDEDEEEEKERMRKSNTLTDSTLTQRYRPPKQLSVPYTDSKHGQPKRISKNIVKELQEEFSEAPETMIEAPETLDTTYQARERFEEDNFVRLTVSKKEKQKFKKPKTMRNELKTFLDGSDDSE
ncbi:hypothetical protein HMI56_002033 [Coelomomyces lativittatus]|nr:hypothetical protein HMI56_002033 [Coelomomyces lativittatus]